MAIGVGPGFFAREHGCSVGETFSSDKTLERGEPMLIVTRAIVGLATVGGGFQFLSESRGPLFPSEMTEFGEFYGEGKGLRLPRFGEDRPAVVARKLGQRGERFGWRNGVRLAQGNRPTCRRKRNLAARLARPTIRAR